MGVLNQLKRINRRHWFICHACLMQTNHDTMKSLFFDDSPGEDFLGRQMHPCPRCTNTNTRSFEQLKDEGSDQALFGLERIVKQNPRENFVVVKPSEATRTT